jgi:hypothetical protein
LWTRRKNNEGSYAERRWIMIENVEEIADDIRSRVSKINTDNDEKVSYYNNGVKDTLFTLIRQYKPKPKREISVLSILKDDGIYKNLIKAICSSIRWEIDESRGQHPKNCLMVVIDKVVLGLSLSPYLVGCDDDIAPIPPGKYGSFKDVVYNLLLELEVPNPFLDYPHESGQVKILISVKQNMNIMFSVGVDTEQLLYMEEL